MVGGDRAGPPCVARPSYACVYNVSTDGVPYTGRYTCRHTPSPGSPTRHTLHRGRPAHDRHRTCVHGHSPPFLLPWQSGASPFLTPPPSLASELSAPARSLGGIFPSRQRSTGTDRQP